MPAHNSLPEFRPSPPTPGFLEVDVVCGEASEAVIFVRGELDRDSVPLLTGCLREILEARGGDRTVVVNLVGTTFIDVGGMCALFDAAGSARERGSRRWEPAIRAGLPGWRPSLALTPARTVMSPQRSQITMPADGLSEGCRSPSARCGGVGSWERSGEGTRVGVADLMWHRRRWKSTRAAGVTSGL
jgi:ABC-type transporter Mla MlaB component